MPNVASLANDSAYRSSGYLQPGGPLTGAGAVRAAGLSPINLTATIQGLNVLTQHFYAISAITPSLIQAITLYYGEVLAELAKENHYKNIDTRATYESIKASEVTPLPSGGSIDVSVSTPQAQFLEFGFVHYQTGEWIFNPFMIPAADAIARPYFDAIMQVISLAGDLRLFTGGAAAAAGGQLAGVRGLLYSYSKFAGDIQSLGFTGLSASRGAALKGAQGLGNVQALQHGTAVARATRVAVGRAGGSFGRTGVTSGFNPSSALSGPAARVYNRVGGRLFGGALSGIGR